MSGTFFNSDQLIILGNLSIAMVLGALIGLDRELAHKPAGLRTHMLVAGSAALLIALGSLTIEYFQQQLGIDLLQSDPIRIIAAVITGVSFLGAGTIIRQPAEGHIEGLTTAASLLFVSALGMCVALSQWLLAIGATIIVLIILRIVPFFERIFRK
jgi:putative Mg2+ transporter-C (MgtC) family protein